MENIGSEYRDEDYEDIKGKLNRSDTITVWVKKSELDYWEQQIFQINTNRETVLDF